MARVLLIGGETGDLSELSVAGAGTAIDGTVFNDAGGKGGAYSIKSAAGSSTSVMFTTVNLSHAYVKFYFRFDTDTIPGTDCAYQLCTLIDTVGAPLFDFYVQQQSGSGNFRTVVIDRGGGLPAGALVNLTIAKNTWYRFDIDITVGNPTGVAKVYKDGVLVINITGQNFGTVNIKTTNFYANSGNAGRNCWLDDYEIDDAGLCGKSYVISRQPKSGTPTYDAWTKSSGTIDTVWDDIPFSATNNASSFISSAAQTALMASFSATQTGHGNGVISAVDDVVNGWKEAFIGKTAAVTGVGVTQVGNILGTSSLNGANVTLTFSVVPQAGDLVVLWGGHTSTRPTPIGPSTAGYTQIGSTQTATTNTFGAWYKVMGAPPDTTVVGQGTGNAADSTGYGAIVLRQTNTGTPLDVTAVFANGNSTNPDPGSITPATTGGAVVICCGSVNNDSAWTSPANYGATVAAASADTNPYSVGGAVRLSGLVAATPENPAVWTAVLTGVWIAATIAIRPATQAGSAISLRDRWNSVDGDSAFTLTTSDAYYETSAFDADAPNTLANANASELGVVHGINSLTQQVEEVWLMASYTPDKLIGANFAGAGSLSATARLSQRVSSTLAGAGALSASAGLGQRVTAAFAGTGAWNTAVQVGHPVLASFAGAGGLSPTVNLGERVGAAYAGLGAWNADIANLKLLSATFAGAGGFSASVSLGMRVEAHFDAVGLLSVDVNIPAVTNIHFVAANFAGLGALSADLRLGMAASAAFAGAGSFATNVALGMRVAAVFTGAGNFATDVVKYKFVDAAWAGAGALSAAVQIPHAVSAAFAGAGALSVPIVQLGVSARATWAGAGSWSASPFVQKLVGATFAGAGAMSALVNLGIRLSSTWNGRGAWDGNVIIAGIPNTVLVNATFAGAGALSANLRQGMQVGASFNGAGGLSGQLRLVNRISAAFAGAGSFSYDLRLGMRIQSAFVGHGSWSADATVVSPVVAVAVPVAAIFAGTGRMFADLDIVTAPSLVPEPTYDYPIKHDLDSDYGIRRSKLNRGRLVIGRR